MWADVANYQNVTLGDPTLPVVPIEPLPNSVGTTPGNSLKSRTLINFIFGIAIYKAKISVDHHSNGVVFSLVSVRHNMLAPSSLCSSLAVTHRSVEGSTPTPMYYKLHTGMYSEVYFQYRISKTTISNYWIHNPTTYPYLEALWKIPLANSMYSLCSKHLKSASPSFLKVAHFQDHNRTKPKRILIELHDVENTSPLWFLCFQLRQEYQVEVGK